MGDADFYLHVADDGGLLVMERSSGKSLWVTEEELRRRLDVARAHEGSIVMSTDRGSPIAARVLDLVAASGVARARATEVHPDAVRLDGVTALMASAYVGARALVEDLLRRGADVSAQDESGYSALMYAANASETDIVALLLEAGALVNQRDVQGSTPLMFAAQHGDLRTVKKLLAAGADPRLRRTADALSAYDIASANGHDRVASILLSVSG